MKSRHTTKELITGGQEYDCTELVFESGRVLDPDQGIVGLNIEDFELSYGYDTRPYFDIDEDGDNPPLTDAERAELADFMIGRWEMFKKGVQHGATHDPEVLFLLKAVAENPISSTDSSCAFCQAYGDAPHDGKDGECPVLIARRLIAASSPADSNSSER